MSRRRKAREVAVQLLFKDDFNPDATNVDRTFAQARLNRNSPLVDFCLELVAGVRAHGTEIDQAIAAVLENWKLERVAAADRSILRAGAFEMIYSDTPGPVIINEYVEIAKRFGDKQSHQFVNGILDRLFRAKAKATSDEIS